MIDIYISVMSMLTKLGKNSRLALQCLNLNFQTSFVAFTRTLELRLDSLEIVHKVLEMSLLLEQITVIFRQSRLDALFQPISNGRTTACNVS